MMVLAWTGGRQAGSRGARWRTGRVRGTPGHRWEVHNFQVLLLTLLMSESGLGLFSYNVALMA